MSHLETVKEEVDSSIDEGAISSGEESGDELDMLDPFKIQKEIQGLSLGAPKASDYIKVESMTGGDKWNILITPTFTVKEAIEKLSKRVDSKYKFFELLQTDGKKSHLLSPDLLICDVINSWKGDDKFKFVFNYQECKHVQIESILDAHKWQIKLGPDATVGFVCDKLAGRIDTRYDVFELYIDTDGNRTLLDRREVVFKALAAADAGTSGANRSKLLFNYAVREGSVKREISSDQLSSHKSIQMVADQKEWPTDKAGMRKPSKKGIGLPKFKPPVNDPQRKEHIKNRGKFSSTSTLFLATTISKPDVEELVHCMAKAVIFHIERGSKISDKIYFDIFDERLMPLSKEIVDFGSVPSVRKVYTFLKRIYDFGRLDPECIIMALAYIEKLLEKTNITIDTTNWRRVAFIALSVALKTWEDFAVYNNEFLGVFNGKLTIKELNVLEMHFLALIEFNVYLPASLYAKYYFELKTYSQCDEGNFPIKPLDKEKAKILELRTQSSQNMAKDLVHTMSLDRLQPTRVKAPAILS